MDQSPDFYIPAQAAYLVLKSRQDKSPAKFAETNKDQGTSPNSDCESDDSTSDGHMGKQSELSRVMTNISEQIQLLYYFGILLRRPGVSRRYLKSGSKTVYTQSAAPPEELSHVREVIRRWRVNTHQVPWDEIKERQRSHDLESPDALSTILTERIARANANRREQFIYWADHPDQTMSEITSLPQDTKSIKSGGTSLFSKNTVAQSDILGVMTHSPEIPPHESPARTIYAETVVGGDHIATVPSAPVNPDNPTFTCPYCHISLDSVAMQDRMTWKYV